MEDKINKLFKIGEEYYIKTADGDNLYILEEITYYIMKFVRKTDGYTRVVVNNSDTYKKLLRTANPLWKAVNLK